MFYSSTVEYDVRITDEMATDEMSTPPPGRSSEGKSSCHSLELIWIASNKNITHILFLVAFEKYGSPTRCGRGPYLETC